MQLLKRSVQYFAFVFGAGFVLGTIRVMFVMPRLGNRMAELAEMPVMLAVVIMASRWVLRHYQPPPTSSERIAMGCIALVLMLVAEFSFVLSLRGLSIGEYFETRDPVSGTAYFVMLGVFAFLPLLIGREKQKRLPC